MFAFSAKGRLKKRVQEYAAVAARILHVEDDILPEKAKALLKSVVQDAEKVELETKAVEDFTSSASKSIETAFPRRGFFYTVRDWLDVLAVAMAVAFGARALYLQPFKIPTSSMQPTLFGIHYVNKDVVPELGSFLDYWLYAAKRVHVVTKDGGETYFISNKGGFSPSLTFGIGNERFTVPVSAERPKNQFLDYGLIDYYERPKSFAPGETVCDGWLSLGDHLFVNRVGIHFLGPQRGDVIVFTTEGIDYPPQQLGGYYYIKRLAGMPGDSIKIESNVLMVKPKGAASFKPVYELSDKFKKVYSGKGGYQGHLMPSYGSDSKPYVMLKEEGQVIEIPENCYFMMGDNTMSSLDSRYWGFVPRKNIVGTAGVVFWPFSRRWGLADSAGAIDSPTALPRSMWLQ